MKRILTQEEKNKKERNKRTIIGAILVLIMILSTASYSFNSITSNKQETIKYKDIKFELQNDGFWHFDFNGEEFATSFNPIETENISVNTNYNIDYYKNKVIYFSDERDRTIISELIANMGRYASRIQEACIENCDKDIPIKDCSEIILITKDGENKIIQDKNCTFIYSQNNSLITADAWIFKLLNIK